ncbi:unnamed protein product [Calicophoron daubneyi]|uniref:acid phosphatase n=1 Tax=Calicophoron daubneyi TaxID=300641 RepID=A0AAV2T0T3_CALDB
MFHNSTTFHSLWPDGFFKLTPTGIVQEFQLGQWFRQRYNSYLGPQYNASDLYIRSSDTDRTLMSAESFLAGIYKDGTSPLEEFGLRWRPIPVHTVAQENEFLLGLASCPLLSKMRDEIMNSSSSKEYENQHRPLLEYLRNATGNHTVNRYNAGCISDSLICMKANEKPLPSWYRDDVFNELLNFTMFYSNKKHVETREQLRLEIGVYVDAFIKHMLSITKLDFIEHAMSRKHVLVFSAHDTTVTNVLAAFGVFDGKMVEYASAVITELVGPHPPADASHYRLRLLYKRGWNDSVGTYILPKPCSTNDGTKSDDGCPLNLVLDYLRPLALKLDDFRAACDVNTTANLTPSRVPRSSTELIWLVCSIAVMIPALCLVYVYVRYRKRKRSVRIDFEQFHSSADA